MNNSSHNSFSSTRSRRILLLLITIFSLVLSSANATTSDSSIMSDTEKPKTTLVVGATGGTGKWVVKLLLDQPDQRVEVIVRSQDRMKSLLKEIGGDVSYGDRLSIVQSPLLDMTDAELQDRVRDCQAVVSCLGHTMDLKGLYGHPRRLVTDFVKRLTSAMKANKSNGKFILMGSEGVVNPKGTDDKRPLSERAIIFLLRYLVPPHADNEEAAAYVHSLGESSSVEWLVVRPTDLIDGEPDGKTNLYPKPFGGLFGAGVVKRANVAKTMVDFLLDNDKWNQWKFQMPVVHDEKTPSGKSEL